MKDFQIPRASIKKLEVLYINQTIEMVVRYVHPLLALPQMQDLHLDQEAKRKPNFHYSRCILSKHESL